MEKRIKILRRSQSQFMRPEVTETDSQNFTSREVKKIKIMQAVKKDLASIGFEQRIKDKLKMISQKSQERIRKIKETVVSSEQPILANGVMKRSASV
jgi:hypothetical protein